MTTSKTLKPDAPAQSKRFEDVAKELGADESGKSFRQALGVVVTRSPASKSNKPLTGNGTPTIVAGKKKSTKEKREVE